MPALERACAEDPALHDRLPEITAALAAAEDSAQAESSGRLSPDSLVQAFNFALEAAPAESAGTRIGPYKLLQEIGRGGFGVVWMAEQEGPIRRRVALKIIKAGMDTKEVIARFEAERQALALMEHPNIARVFDAGATDAGRPFFVMELVRGVAITRYCDENRLSVEARLRLFIMVCHAVQHAHQKGVIHRDLKPSNILVTLHDGVPVPKVIDFGVAKATMSRLTEKTLFTQFHAFIGTPAYTSPEQMEMSGLDVDTRSDIYSLGVLLYELLAGRPPFDASELVKSGFEAMRRTIREVDPPRPSHRLTTLAKGDRITVAQQRGTEASKLSLLLHGDLDWIVMRCLEKDRTRRYETANNLARDVQLHLENEPVTARPPNAFYRIGKFARRHHTAVAAAAAVLLALVVGLSLALVGFRRAVVQRRSADAARRQAEGLVGLMTQDLAPTLEQRGGLPQLLKTTEATVHYYESLPTELRSPKTDQRFADALAALGRVRGRSLNDRTGAEAAMRAALALREKISRDNPGDPEATTAWLRDESEMPALIGDVTATIPEARWDEILRHGRQLHARFPDDLRVKQCLAELLAGYAGAAWNQFGKPHEGVAAAAECQKLVEELLAAQRKNKAPPASAGRSLLALADALMYTSEGASKEAFEQALAYCTDALKADPGNLKLREQTAEGARNLSYITAVEEKKRDAELIAREHYRVLIELNPDDQMYRLNYAVTHMMECWYLFNCAPDFEAAPKAFREFHALLEPFLGRGGYNAWWQWTWIYDRMWLAAFAAWAGEPTEARQEIERAQLRFADYCSRLPEGSFERCYTRVKFLSLKEYALYSLRDWPAMEGAARDCLAEIEAGLRQKPANGPLLSRQAEANAFLAVAAQREGRPTEAIALLQPAIVIMRAAPNEYSAYELPSILGIAQKALTESFMQHGDQEQAKQAAEQLLLGFEVYRFSTLPEQDWEASALTLAASLCDSAEATRCIGLADRAKTMLTSPAAIGRLTVDGKENLAIIARLCVEAEANLAQNALERTGRQLDAAAATDPEASDRFTRAGEATWNLLPNNSAVSSQKARAAELAAREGYRALMARYPANEGYRFLFAETHRMECFVHLGWDGLVEPARAAFRQYDALLEPFVGRKGYDSVLRTRLFNSLYLAQLAASIGDKADADRWLKEAQNRFEMYRNYLPERSPDRSLALARFLEESAWSAWWLRDWPELARLAQKARAECEAGLKEQPASDELLKRQAMADGFAALALAGKGPNAEAATRLQTARDRLKTTKVTQSVYGVWDGDLVVWATEDAWVEVLRKNGNLSQASNWTNEFLNGYERWVPSFPEYWRAQKHLAAVRILAASVLDPTVSFEAAQRKELLDRAAATLASENVAGRLTVDVQEALREIERYRAATVPPSR
jgi:serine/threonine protein kinase